MSFLDAYAGYNQIKMNSDDEEHTNFVTSRGMQCYSIMPFGLKNAGATFWRLVTTMFKDQLGDFMEVYIDDLIIKSLRKESHIGHMRTIFNILRQYMLKLNPEKCVWAVSIDLFLDHIVNKDGISVNPDQIRAVMEMKESENIKEIEA